MASALQVPDRAAHLAVDLVNAQLPDAEALRQFLVAHGEPEPVTVDDTDTLAVTAVRERIRPVFDLPADAAAALLNALLAEFAERPHLSDHDGTSWHVHATRADATWAEWIAGTGALGLALYAAAHGFTALGTCAAPDCTRVFVNPAERRVRRFCTPNCATRTRVAAHRARRRP
ncbi:CGNR zinc finger domain-containing protein [Pseudonocardia sp. CA-107938]|uniref:CGNR zinc finger domain-containing protein n=1 Tax=Pseudonocardia sp. CA-107938 TaxID=3240021 RepID=UPI003D8B2A63